MLEFYPMPTNLNHGGGLFPHHQNHGGARFLDNPTTAATTTMGASGNTPGLSNSNNCGQLQQQQLTTSPTHATCPPNNNSNNNSPISVSACSTASLTAQTISATTTTPTILSSSTALPSHSQQLSASLSVNPNATPTLSSSSPSSSSSATSSTNGHHHHHHQHHSLSHQQHHSSFATLSPTSSSKLSADCSGRTEVGHIKCEKNYEICEGCGQKIHDRYLMNVGDANWHEQCLACSYCGLQLHHTCYVRNSKLYCKLDYDRLYGVKCAACCHPILPQEMVMRPIPNFIFHLPCFVCYACRLPLQKGEQFMLRDGQLFCYRHDLEKELYLAAAAQHCGFVGLDEDDLMRPRDGRRGPKRPRTILTSQQRKQFKASFDQSPKPCRKVREALAKDTGLSVRVVQVWFQNQRAKMKKIQRKAKNAGSGGATGRGGDDKDKDKEEKVSGVKQESGSGSENGYLSLDSAFASQPLNPNLPFSPDDYPANSNDSFCSSDLSLDGSNFDQLDDDTDSLSLNNLELQSTGSSGNQHSNPHDMLASLNTSLINPIDKLYLMQNSYFNSEQ